MTAAHCAINSELVSVRLGEQRIGSEMDGASPIDLAVRKKTLHPDYNPRTFDNDIAILTLNESVTFTEKVISPICMPSLDFLAVAESGDSKFTKDSKFTEDSKFTGKPGFVAGWGSTRFRGKTSPLLMQATLSVRHINTKN